MTSPPRHDLVALDALRGLAAFAVVLGHTRAQVLLGQGNPTQGDGWQKVVLAPTGFAAEAVALFFVISGFLVGGQVIRNVRGGHFTWRSYAIRRLSRLYIVVIPAILFTVVVDTFVRHVMQPGPTTERADKVPSTWEFACNAVFLQNSRCHSFGGNGSLWSLSYEFWFYVSFAVGALAVAAIAARNPAKAALNLVLLVAIVVLFGWNLLWLAPSWLLGAALAWWHDNRSVPQGPAHPWKFFASVASLLVVSGTSTVLGHDFDVSSWKGIGALDVAGFLALGLTATAIVHFAIRPSRLWEGQWLRPLAFVGGWSFTMYAFHRPIVMVVATAYADWFNFTSVVEVAAIYLTSVAIAAVCYPLYFVAEARTDDLRAWLFKVTDRHPEPAPNKRSGSDVPDSTIQ